MNTYPALSLVGHVMPRRPQKVYFVFAVRWSRLDFYFKYSIRLLYYENIATDSPVISGCLVMSVVRLTLPPWLVSQRCSSLLVFALLVIL